MYMYIFSFLFTFVLKSLFVFIYIDALHEQFLLILADANALKCVCLWKKGKTPINPGSYSPNKLKTVLIIILNLLFKFKFFSKHNHYPAVSLNVVKPLFCFNSYCVLTAIVF